MPNNKEIAAQRARLVIAPGKEKAVLRRHPWIFSGAVARMEGRPAEGDLVDVYSATGQWMATGHYQPQTIVCKVLSFDTAQVDDDFVAERLREAFGYRLALGFFAEKTNVFRLVHAEGDFLPGLVADWYNGIVVLQAHSVGMHRMFPAIVDALVRLSAEMGIRLQAVFDKSLTAEEGAQTNCYIYGDTTPTEWEVMENGRRMTVNFFEGQKTGFFIDQRDNRHLVAELSRGRKVLNCFGYTGGFSIAALDGGARLATTVDISGRAIELANRNVQLAVGSGAPHQGVVADVMQYLAAQHDEGYDFIILDPPAFAKNHHALQQGLKGYRAINRRAMQMLPKRGLLMTFSCSQAVSTADFRTMVFSAAAMAGRRVRIVRTLPHAADHPISVFHPEGEYLKGLLLQVE